MSKAVVFIGMPVYNGERHLGEAIEYILSQSFTDFVLYISDDGSTDTTRTMCELYAARDPRIVYYPQPKNLGVFENFKFVLDKADAEYFMWAAQDDIRERDYLQVCVEKLEQDKTLGLTTATTAIIDTFGRVLAIESEVQRLSGKPGFLQVARYTLQPEGLGKCNLTYGLFRVGVARAVWHAYPWRGVWGHDYHFVLALISRFGVYVDEKPLFKKRLGGYSSPDLVLEKASVYRMLPFAERNNNTFPFKRFRSYFDGHMEALCGTPYRPLAAVLLYFRLPRAFFVYVGERNYKKFFRNLIGLRSV